MIKNKKLVIGLFGFGVVGEGIYNVLKQTPTLQAEIKKICIKNSSKTRNAEASLFTTCAEDLINDPEINTIVELIDDAECAYLIVKNSLLKNKSVVSANKKMIALHLKELMEIQALGKISFLYEAAVCGSIPVIRNLEEYYDNDLLHSISGIVNGSTNFILTKMNAEGMSYSNALALAQKLGFAESNPALDVEGFDAVNKLTIVLQHAYGILAKPEEILRFGITNLHESDNKYANEKGYRIKLVATAKKTENNTIVASVIPTFVDKESQLYNIQNEFNGVLIGSKLSDQQFLYGKGAGRYPTASAVLSDISALRYNYKYEYKKNKSSSNYQLTKNDNSKVYVSFKNENDIDYKDFESVEETYTSADRKYLIGTVNHKNLHKAKWLRNINNSIIAMEHV